MQKGKWTKAEISSEIPWILKGGESHLDFSCFYYTNNYVYDWSTLKLGELPYF